MLHTWLNQLHCDSWSGFVLNMPLFECCQHTTSCILMYMYMYIKCCKPSWHSLQFNNPTKLNIHSWIKLSTSISTWQSSDSYHMEDYLTSSYLLVSSPPLATPPPPRSSFVSPLTPACPPMSVGSSETVVAPSLREWRTMCLMHFDSSSQYNCCSIRCRNWWPCSRCPSLHAGHIPHQLLTICLHRSNTLLISAPYQWLT